SRPDRCGCGRGEGAEEADSSPRAGERGPPSGCGVLVAGEPAPRWLPKMTYPLVAEHADAGIPVTVSCRVLKLARQPYYRWRNDPVRDADGSVRIGSTPCTTRTTTTRHSDTDTSPTKPAGRDGG